MNELEDLLNKAHSEGLTFEEKQRLNEIKPYELKCQCASRGEHCKLHGIQYEDV